MNKRKIIASLNDLANQFDSQGMTKEADSLTKVMLKLAQTMSLEEYLNQDRVREELIDWCSETRNFDMDDYLTRNIEQDLQNLLDAYKMENNLDGMSEDQGLPDQGGTDGIFENDELRETVKKALYEEGFDTAKEIFMDALAGACSQAESWSLEDPERDIPDVYERNRF